MTVAAVPILTDATAAAADDGSSAVAAPPDTLRRRLWANARIRGGGGVLLAILLLCLVTLPRTARVGSDLYYDQQHDADPLARPDPHHPWMWFGTTKLGQSLLGRCLIGGLLSLAIGVTAAAVSVGLGVTVGLVAGYQGGWVDAGLMRVVDVLYGLPYVLMVILMKIALQAPLGHGIDRLANGTGSKVLAAFAPQVANLTVLFLAIGLVSWLTMARVVRGQVLSLRAMPFVDAARAMGVPRRRIFLNHLLPNLVGPIAVYAALTVPGAILQESMLSFLGIGIQPPLPTWGSLASEGLKLALSPIESSWWLLAFPCGLLAVTLLALNFLGDGLRDVFDPKRRASNV